MEKLTPEAERQRIATVHLVCTGQSDTVGSGINFGPLLAIELHHGSAPFFGIAQECSYITMLPLVVT